MNHQKQTRFYAVPRTPWGMWGAGLLVGTFLVLIMMVSITSVMNRVTPTSGTAVSLGVANVAYIIAVVCGIVLSWMAVFAKRDLSVVLIVIASIFSILLGMLVVVEFVLPF